MFTKVLIANRGVIACRIIRTLRRLGVGSVAVYSDADADSLHVEQADEAIRIGDAPAAQSYLSAEAILQAARTSGAQAIHPGYGFLSESAQFAKRCADTGITFIGPTPEQIRAFGLKHTARELAGAAAIPLLEGSGLVPDASSALAAAEHIGYPVMLKATAGGGGIGMRICEVPQKLQEAFASVAHLASQHFADGGVYLERHVRHARHIEVQVFGDGGGRVAALGERDCSLQRRHQKVIEETPAPGLSDGVRARLAAYAVQLMTSVCYRSAGTVEFLYDSERSQSYFLEVNTRLQVEHGVTEEVAGIDLVEWMIRCAAGESGFLEPWLGPEAWRERARGASIQARLYAEDPARAFRPAAGTLTRVRLPAGARVESWVCEGSSVSPHYDALLAKVIVVAGTREQAVRKLYAALEQTSLSGLETNVEWLRQVVASAMFAHADLSTHALEAIAYTPRAVRVVSGGLATTVQDYPGRQGYWNVGVPPSGPMDALSFRIGNRLLGNPQSAAGLEWTATGPTLEFDHAATICLTGAQSLAMLDGHPVAHYEPVAVAAGQTLKIARASGPGMRGYVLFRGGLDVPEYLGSRATFTLGGFGGHAGRNLTAGDVLRFGPDPASPLETELAAALRPELRREWSVRVLYGPQGAPDFFTEEDIETFISTPWRVHYNSSRTGVRLVGPRPRWARRDGGEAGLHPSNIHDNPYAIGAIDFTGDMPIILGPDGPSLGGFVCPFVTIQADLWKIGQLTPGDIVRFECVEPEQAAAAEREQDEQIASLHGTAGLNARANPARVPRAMSPVLDVIAPRGLRPQVLYRRQGDRHLLVEYGPPVLDLTLCLRAHALMQVLERMALPGVLDVTPGIRSLQVHFDGRKLNQASLLETLAEAEEQLGTLEDFEITSRVVHLPLSFRDPVVEETVRRYMTSVRNDAPWCPDNIEFIRRVNGLDSVDEVRRIVFDASYLVLGLGDVYLGAPVAIPLDPRHRLVTTKYNPARTWTPPNVVGIGGAYLCIYGLEGPGGYQLFGRTIQVWNTFCRDATLADDKPWLLRFFDQIRFFPVSAAELAAWRTEFPRGRRPLDIRAETFRLTEYQRFLVRHQASIAAFQARRQAAFEAEREAWQENQEPTAPSEGAGTEAVQQQIDLPAYAEIVEAPLGGNVLHVFVRPGDSVEKGTVIATIEAMKAECSVQSPAAGRVHTVYVRAPQAVSPGAALVALQPATRRATRGDR